jgi:hypothetical protein
LKKKGGDFLATVQVAKIEVEYHLLDGKIIEKTRNFPGEEERKFPWFFAASDFVSQPEENPQGFFVITNIIQKPKKRFILKQVDCDPKHWKGDENGRGHGPDEECKKKKCPFLDNCPISVHLIMTADVD